MQYLLHIICKSTALCLNIGIHKISNFPFETNGKLMILYVPVFMVPKGFWSVTIGTHKINNFSICLKGKIYDFMCPNIYGPKWKFNDFICPNTSMQNLHERGKR